MFGSRVGELGIPFVKVTVQSVLEWFLSLLGTGGKRDWQSLKEKAFFKKEKLGKLA